MSFKITVASLKESLEAEKEVIASTLKEMEKENVRESSVKKLLEKLQDDIDSFVSKVEASLEDGLKDYDMVKYLNNMLNIEYQGIFDYNYYASLVSDEQLADSLKSFGAMEIEHAHLLTKKIKKLGAKPNIPGAVKRGRYDNALDMLKEHAIYEKEAIRLCEEGVQVFSDPEFQWILGTIRVDEIEHQKKIAELIKRFEEVELTFKVNSKYNTPKEIDFDSDEPWTEG